MAYLSLQTQKKRQLRSVKKVSNSLLKTGLSKGFLVTNLVAFVKLTALVWTVSDLARLSGSV